MAEELVKLFMEEMEKREEFWINKILQERKTMTEEMKNWKDLVMEEIREERKNAERVRREMVEEINRMKEDLVRMKEKEKGRMTVDAQNTQGKKKREVIDKDTMQTGNLEIEKIKEEVMEEMNKIKSDFQERIKNIQESCNNSICRTEEMKKGMDDWRKIRIESEENMKLQQEESESMAKRMEMVDKYRRRRNMIIKGIKENENENDEDLRKSVMEVLENRLKITGTKIAEYRRIGRKRDGQERAIRIEVAEIDSRKEIWKKKVLLKGSEIFIEWDLTWEERAKQWHERKRSRDERGKNRSGDEGDKERSKYERDNERDKLWTDRLEELSRWGRWFDEQRKIQRSNASGKERDIII
jgi:hypothetical protein